MTARGFGVAAAMLSSLTGPLAAAAESHGYDSFWVNDTPGADGFDALRRAAEVTNHIRLGVGVIPVDRRSAVEIIESIERSGLPIERLVVGIGAGSTLYGSIDNVRSAIREIHRRANVKVAVGAMGPKMVALAAEEADAVLLNWLTPRQAKLSAADVRQQEGDGHHCQVVGYVRVALPDGFEQLSGEGDRYASYPQYARHFARMQANPMDTCVIGDREQIQSGLGAFDQGLDETVVRAVAAAENLDEYMGILVAAAPNAN